MTAFWHPVGALWLEEPPCLPTRRLLGALLAGDEGLELRYLGDRMWPAVSHGDRFRVARAEAADLQRGDAVVAPVNGPLELLRIDRVAGDSVDLRADADPDFRTSLLASEVLAVAELPRRLVRGFEAFRRRARLDLREALHEGPDGAEDAAATVRDKYDSQAPLYSANPDPTSGAGLSEDLERELVAALPPEGRVLVVGSGAGRECLALGRAGHRVTGIDFAASMVERASRSASEAGVELELLEADVRTWSPERGAFDGILFTFDVYSFLPGRSTRTDVLRRLATGLADDGSLFLSARLARSLRSAATLSVQRRARPAVHREWGDSHTRWIDARGELRRSYVHVFRQAALEEEVRAAGLAMREPTGGHVRLTRGPTCR